MKHKEYATGILTGVLITALAAGGLNFVHGKLSNSVLSDPSNVEKVEYLEKLIDQEYLGDIDKSDLAEGIYAGLLYGLGDVYSRYYTAEEYAQETASTDGSYVGIGVSIQKNKNGGVQIAECYEGGSGKKAGLISGDVITAIDDTDVTDMELSEVVHLIIKKIQHIAVYHQAEISVFHRRVSPVENRYISGRGSVLNGVVAFAVGGQPALRGAYDHPGAACRGIPAVVVRFICGFPGDGYFLGGVTAFQGFCP